MHGGNIVFASFPIELFKRSTIYDPDLKGNTFIFDADFNVLRDYIDRFQQGTWPDPTTLINNTPTPLGTDAAFACED